MIIRPSTPADLPQMQHVFAEAKLKMRADGNLEQWDGTYPEDSLLLEDMQKGQSYVVLDGDDIVATFVMARGCDPTYAKIYEGSWLDDEREYVTIHRIASLSTVHGIADLVFGWCFAQVPNIRIDTHADNKLMQHILQSRGFTYCGIIYLLSGDPRLAFQKL